MSKNRGVATIVASAARRLLVTAAIIFLDPFNFGAVTEQASADVFTKLASPWYPTTERDRIVVVMIEESDLPLAEAGCPLVGECEGKTWPIAFSEHAALINSIIGDDPEGYPAAVFIDILFNNPHVNDPSFGSLAEVAARGGAKRSANYPPIVFATEPQKQYDPSSPQAAPVRGSPSLLEGVEGALTAHVSWIGEGYPLSVNDNGADERTAAAALYEFASGDKLAGDAPPMMALWGYNPIAGSTYAELQKDGAQAERACPKAETSIARAAAMSVAAASGAFANANDRASARWRMMQPCSFHAEISAADMLPSGFESEFRFRETLKGSFVIVAARIAGIADNVTSPVHGMLPGGYYHAMALDNLLVFGDSYFRAAPRIGAAALPLSGAFEFVLLFLGVCAATGISFSQRPGWRTKAFTSLMIFGAALGLLYLSATVMRSPAINWLGALTLAIGNILQAAPRGGRGGNERKTL